MEQRPDGWNPAQYERFRAEREQPFFDLLALIRRSAAGRVADLGCGTGALTAHAHATLGAAQTVGIDSSPAMLERARQIEVPGLTFVQRDIATWVPDASCDVIFSNAALHWVTGHPALFARLRGMLAPAGELAVQMPANFDHASHVVAAGVAREEPFSSAIGGYVRESPVLAPEEYSSLLHDLGFVEQHVRMQVYAHMLESTASVVEWVRGSLLTDYEVRMPASMYERFVERYRDSLLDALGDRRPYFYAFKRILLWARVPS